MKYVILALAVTIVMAFTTAAPTEACLMKRGHRITAIHFETSCAGERSIIVRRTIAERRAERKLRRAERKTKRAEQILNRRAIRLHRCH